MEKMKEFIQIAFNLADCKYRSTFISQAPDKLNKTLRNSFTYFRSRSRSITILELSSEPWTIHNARRDVSLLWDRRSSENAETETEAADVRGLPAWQAARRGELNSWAEVTAQPQYAHRGHPQEQQARLYQDVDMGVRAQECWGSK